MAKRWGLALGAGGLYGLAYVGVFKALAEAGLRPDVVSGTSAGAIAAGLYAAGVALDDIERELRQMAVPSR
ncbi:MAG: patatin-like phospholipase family protein, partial [Bacillota bacterium]